MHIKQCFNIVHFYVMFLIHRHIAFTMCFTGLPCFAFLVLFSSLHDAFVFSYAGDALHVFKKSLSDPGNVLQSWDPTLVNPCTWFHVTCNQDNNVVRM